MRTSGVIGARGRREEEWGLGSACSGVVMVVVLNMDRGRGQRRRGEVDGFLKRSMTHSE